MAYTENPRPVIRCQYWVLNEPLQCIHWDQSKTVCTYKVEKIVAGVSYAELGDLYPYCNYIGTASDHCSKYEADDSGDASEGSPRCVLPDPFRHVARTPNCGKWITAEGVVDGAVVPLDLSSITGYNEGNCNFVEDDDTTGGTDGTCAGHTPQHLGFSGKPIPESCELVTPGPDDDPLIITSVGTNQLPMNFEVLNKRAELGKCGRWDSSDITFEFEVIDGVVNTGTILAPEFACNSTNSVVQEFSKFYEDVENKYVRPPCNGACPDCPKYTGNLASTGYLPFLSSIFLRHGDKIMAEQVLELRYNIKKETWDPEQYELLFGGATTIYAHEGEAAEVISNSEGVIIDYSLQAMKVKIKDFDCLAFERTPILLTKGTPTDNEKTDFPTLIEQIGELPLSPIIHTSFDTPWDNGDTTISYSQKTEYVYETPFTDHEVLLIVGDHFSITGDPEDIFAINISDESIAFPFPELLKFQDIYEYKNSVGAKFVDDHSKLACYFKVLKDIAPDKIYYNTIKQDNRAFITEVKTVFGKNKIMVFDVSRPIYSYAVIEVTKYYCGGVVAQTGYSVEAPNKEAGQFLTDYEFLNGHSLFKPTLSYSFKSFHSSDGGKTIPYTTYLDTKYAQLRADTDLSPNAHYILGYRMYRIKVLTDIFVDRCDTNSQSSITLLGNQGYMLIVIDDTYKLHSVIRDWDTGELDANGEAIPMDLILRGTDSLGDYHEIAMEIVEYCSDRLETNQLILKPKDLDKYVRLYGYNISFGDIYVYERRSFGQEPEGEFTEIRDGWAEEDVVTRADTTLEGDMSTNEFTISTPPIASIIATVVYKGGVTLRIKGQAKTDLMNWVKQPFCSDVEIMYSWTAAYRSYTLLPTHYCFVDGIGVSYTPPNDGEGPTYPLRSYTPYCGDHGFGRISTSPAPMWYPYNSCESYASYAIYAGSGENDAAPMEFWVSDSGKFQASDTHNTEDLRMLGPATNFGITTDVHTSIWACGCDWTHMNLEMTGTPWFSGWARIRSGVEGEAYTLMTQNGGEPPKFGNKKRGYLMSYRSTAFVHYYQLGYDGVPEIKYKWMPPYEGFSLLDLGTGYQEYPWKHYFNISDNVSTYMSQFGIVGANSIDNVGISEELVKGEEVGAGLTRYRFTDIFEAHHTLLGTRYPEPRKAYYIGDDLKQVTAWLTYKDYQEDSSMAIQWAWRERWKNILRGKPDLRSTLRSVDISNCTKASYNGDYLSFVALQQPNYTYDYRISEFRRVAAEGTHTLHWEPSISDSNDPIPTHFLLWLDNGPFRIFDPTCVLITDSSLINDKLEFSGIAIEDVVKATDFYEACSGTFWLNGVTSDSDLEGLAQTQDLADVMSSASFMLYTSNTIVTETEEGAIANAVEDDREVVTSDSSGEQLVRYFNRGLVAGLKEDMLQYLPRIDVLWPLEYEFSLNKTAHDDSQFSTVVPLEYYPVTPAFGMVYNGLIDTDVTITFRFPRATVIGKVEVVFNKGEILDEEDINIKTCYNIPRTVIYKSLEGQSYDEILSTEFEFAEEGIEPDLETVTYDIDDSDLEYMSELYHFMAMKFTYKPTEEDLSDQELEYDPGVTPLMDIRMIRIFYVEYTTDNTEIHTTYERKFNISVGSFGDIPVHGHDNIGSLLYPDPWELSTIYQKDNSSGMIGAPGWVDSFNSVSKIRGRKVQKIRTDPEVLVGDYSDFEHVQKELFDEVALDGVELITFTSFPSEMFSAALEGTNVNVFPSWSCTLENKNMVPLADVTQKSKYYPEGHHWTWGLDNVRDFFNCGGGGKRSWKTLFDYKWCRISGVYGCTYDTDAVFDLYTYAVSKALTYWANNSGLG